MRALCQILAALIPGHLVLWLLTAISPLKPELK
jgi:hypothetical protein